MIPTENFAYSAIEGDWKNFRFRRILPQDNVSVFQHLASSFLKDEPTCKLLGYSDEFAKDFNKIIAKILKDNMSFLAENKETGEIAGVRITFQHTKDSTFDDIQLDSYQCKTLIGVIGEAEIMAKIPESLGSDSWAELFAASTGQNYRNQGLAGEFYRRSIAFFKASGFKHAIVLVSSPYTRASTKKYGFVELSRLEYSTLKGVDGDPVFKAEELGPEHFICARFKALSD